MRKLAHQHIKIKAGRINLDRFRQIIKILIRFQINEVAIGEQQTLCFETNEDSDAVIKAIEALNFRFKTTDNHNLVSSIPALNIVASTPWIHAGVYSKISQSFPEKKPLSVRITDPAQRLVSLFGSQINFIASEHLNFWYLYIRKPNGTYFLWPVMINSNSVGDTYQVLCELLVENPLLEEKKLINKLNQHSISISTRSYIKQPSIESMEFPYYDGLHYTGSDYWFGFSGAKGYFKTIELDAFFVLLEHIQIKEIYLNLRGGLLLKGINPANVAVLNQWIKQSSFKTGRAFNELGWQYDAFDFKAYQLKEKLAKQLAERGNENYGFSLKLVRKNQLNLTKEDTDYIISYSSFFSSVTFLDQFRLWTKQSNKPTDGIYKSVGSSQSFNEISENLYSKLLVASKSQLEINFSVPLKEVNLKENNTYNKEYKCKECDTIYDIENGDVNQGILPGTSFESLAKEYICNVCGAEKNSIELV